MAKEIPYILYLWVQRKAYDKSVDGTIKKKDFSKLFMGNHIPKKLWQPIIKEMESLGLLEKKNRYSIQIINIDKNSIDNLHKLQEQLGFF